VAHGVGVPADHNPCELSLRDDEINGVELGSGMELGGIGVEPEY